MKRLAIIGGGFMGSALAEGLLGNGWRPGELVVAERHADRAAALQDHLGIEVTPNAAAAAHHAPRVLLATKPQDIESVMHDVAGAVLPQALIISIAAGVRLATMQAVFVDHPIIRAMPNTPVAIGMGATALAKGDHATDTHLVEALNVFGCVGRTVVVDEAQMDSVTAVSGTGPAYVFLLAEALIEAAQAEGLTQEQAYALTYQTFAGAARLLTHDPASPAELRRRVTSPHGTTHAAVTHLEEHGWTKRFREAVRAARRRSEELGR
jgi:pyrroline-5-carboxylate reductase